MIILSAVFSIDLNGKKLPSCQNSDQTDEKYHIYEAFYRWPFERESRGNS